MYWGLLSGLVASGITLAFLSNAKKREIDAYVKGLEEAAVHGRGTSDMAHRVVALRNHLSSYGEEYAQQVATREGNRVIESVYGLTPMRISQVRQLAASVEEFIG